MLHIVISNSSEIPIYEQIFIQMKDAILNGNLKSGEALPSLRFLAKELKVSVISTKRAYEELEREGYILSVQGRGSFVTEMSKELVRQEQVSIMEEYLQKAIWEAIKLQIPLEVLQERFMKIYEEEKTSKEETFR